MFDLPARYTREALCGISLFLWGCAPKCEYIEHSLCHCHHPPRVCKGNRLIEALVTRPKSNASQRCSLLHKRPSRMDYRSFQVKSISYNWGLDLLRGFHSAFISHLMRTCGYRVEHRFDMDSHDGVWVLSPSRPGTAGSPENNMFFGISLIFRSS